MSPFSQIATTVEVDGQPTPALVTVHAGRIESAVSRGRDVTAEARAQLPAATLDVDDALRGWLRTRYDLPRRGLS